MGCRRDRELNTHHAVNTNATPHQHITIPNQSCDGAAYGSNQQRISESKMFSDQQNMMMMSSSRWNPMPEQLLALEEIFRRGIRTPTTEQIQQIAQSLRRFGKIEGKNVFYWFQNHKARERQKRRREEEEASVTSTHQDCRVTHENLDKKGSGFRKTVNEADQTRSSVSSSTCSKVTEDLVSLNWTQSARVMDDHRHATWQDQELLQHSPTLLINRSANTTTVTKTTSVLNSSNPLSTPYYCFITSPLGHIQANVPNFLEDENREGQTLELFPLRGDRETRDINVGKRDMKLPYLTPIANPDQYFEFIPLKN